ncbi:MAG TPA: S-layer family protein, partial [Allocoleopsis sp.]
GATGDGGNLTLETGRLIVRDGADVSASTWGIGKAGDLNVRATDVEVSGSSSGLFAQVNPGATGDGGNLTLETGRLIVRDDAEVSASTFGAGDAGNLTVRATDSVEVSGNLSGLFAQVNFGATGDGGNLTLETGRLIVRDGADVSASTWGIGKAGDLNVRATDVEVNGSGSGLFAQVNSGAQGDGGNLTLETGRLIVQNQAKVSASGFGTGNAGEIIIRAKDSVNLINSGAIDTSSAALDTVGNLTFGKGAGGGITIETRRLSLQNNASIITSTFGQGSAGSLKITATDSVNLDTKSSLFTSSVGTGSGGDLSIKTNSLTAQGGSSVATFVSGQGNAGRLTVEATDSVNLSGGSGLSTSSLGIGTGGELSIKTGSLSVRDGAQVFTSTFDPNSLDLSFADLSGLTPSNLALILSVISDAARVDFTQGNSGNLKISAGESVNVVNGALISTSATGRASGGTLSIETPKLSIQQAQISTNTAGSGNAGALKIGATDWVEVIQGRLAAETTPNSVGNGGDIAIDTQNLLIRDGGAISASTSGAGKGGTVSVRATEAVQVIGATADNLFSAGLFASTPINVTPEGLFPSGIFAATSGSGNGGNLRIATTRLTIGNQGTVAVNALGTSHAGDIYIKAGSVELNNQASVTVSSPQGQAGNLNITANTLTLNQGTLSAVTGTSGAEGGANITLSGLDFLRMDNESLISASALGNANGGNVTIDSTLIVATPPTGPQGSDIIANADRGNGGRVNVTTQGLFGIQFRPQRTPNNDITVSSTYGIAGEYTLNTPGVDPSRGLAELPTNVVDASQQIDQRCTANNKDRKSNSFTITGRGGLPPSPNDPLQGESVITPNWITINSEENNTPPTPNDPRRSAPERFVEAQGWSINEQGQVVLTAASPNLTPHDKLMCI